MLGKFSQWLEGKFFRLIFWTMDRLSPQRAIALLAFVFGLAGRISDKADKADINLSIAFPEQSAEWRKQTTQQIFRSLGKATAELIKLNQIWEEREQRLEFVVQPLARQHLEAHQATVFVSAHIGAWQVTTLLTNEMNLDNNLVYAAESNAALRDMMLELRQSFGGKLISTEDGLRPLLRELNNNACIGMASDTRPDSGPLIPFFGREALTNVSAARLALRTNAALIPIRGERLGKGRFRITVFDPVTNDLPDAPAEEQAIAMTSRVNEYFEQWIRENPGQWICLKRRWPKAHRL